MWRRARNDGARRASRCRPGRWAACARYLPERERAPWWVCGQVLGLLLNWALPAIAGMEYLLNMESGSVIDEMNRLITNHLATPVSHPVDSSAETTKAKTS
jgi:hypothetical protein